MSDLLVSMTFLDCFAQIDDPVHDKPDQVHSGQRLKQDVLSTVVGLG